MKRFIKSMAFGTIGALWIVGVFYVGDAVFERGVTMACMYILASVFFVFGVFCVNLDKLP